MINEKKMDSSKTGGEYRLKEMSVDYDRRDVVPKVSRES